MTDSAGGKTAVHVPDALTENKAFTFSTTHNAVVDFFFEVVPRCSPDTLQGLLNAAYEADAQLTLRAIFHLGNVKDGKADRANFYESLDWLRVHHPLTFLANLSLVAQHTCWKCPADLLSIAIEGIEAFRARCQEHHKRTRDDRIKRKSRKKQRKQVLKDKAAELKEACGDDKEAFEAKWKEYQAENKALVEERVAGEQEAAKQTRVAKRAAEKERLKESLDKDDHTRQLLDTVAKMFAEQLGKDLEAMKQKKTVNYAAKWAPSLNGYHDNITQLAGAIAAELYADRTDLTPQQKKDLYRKEFLSPLRAYTDVPEVFMSANKWDQLPYERVPSRCMKLNKKAFVKHDGERFAAFLEKVVKGEKKIAAGAVLPHELLKPFMNTYFSRQEDNQSEAEKQTNELQWNRLVADLMAKGGGCPLKNNVAVCDVSGSMTGEPMEVAIALSLITAQVSDEPWGNTIITFSQRPTFFSIDPQQTLEQKVQAIQRMEWGANTDLQAVFDQILARAKEFSVQPDDMPQQLFIFSDMEFDCATGQSHGRKKTDFNLIQDKFAEAGYPMPHIIFWNLRASGSKPTVACEEGVALLSGFSSNLLTAFMSGELEQFTPQSVMMDMLNKDTYNGLKVID